MRPLRMTECAHRFTGSARTRLCAHNDDGALMPAGCYSEILLSAEEGIDTEIDDRYDDGVKCIMVPHAVKRGDPAPMMKIS